MSKGWKSGEFKTLASEFHLLEAEQDWEETWSNRGVLCRLCGRQLENGETALRYIPTQGRQKFYCLDCLGLAHLGITIPL